MRRRALTVLGWFALHALHLLLKVLSLVGSRWAKKKLRASQQAQRHPLLTKARTAARRTAAGHRTGATKDGEHV